MQTTFLKNVQYRNSFEEDSQDLLVLNTKEITAPPGAVDAIRHAHEVGQVQFDNFVREHLLKRTKKEKMPSTETNSKSSVSMLQNLRQRPSSRCNHSSKK